MMNSTIMTDRQTGYPSIDRPWLKYYTRDELELDIPKKSISRFVDEITSDYRNSIAIDYYGRKITYVQLKKERDRVANSLRACGVKPGDIVSICLPNVPEVAYIFYAVNKIGAVANMLDVRSHKELIEQNVDRSDTKIAFVLDSVVSLFENTQCTRIVSISALRSMNFITRMLAGITMKKEKCNYNDKIVSYDAFISLGKNVKDDDTYCYKENSAAVIAYTGGTTGTPKGVVMSNEAFNAMVIENSVMGYDYEPGDRILNIAPPWTYYGLSNCLNANLCMNITNILIPKFEADELGELIRKKKPNHIITVPSTLVGFMNDKRLKNADLSFIKVLIVGADRLDSTLESKANTFLKEHGCNAKITKGYGMTEVCAAAAYTKGQTNIPETVGIPYLFENITAFEIDDYNIECKFNQQGELAIAGPKNMLEYYDDISGGTQEVLRTHSDGTIWVHTGDIGYVDQNGLIYVSGRTKRMFVKNGFKIFPAEIEKHVMKVSGVQSASVVSREDIDNGLAIVLFVVLCNHEFDCKAEEQKIIKQLEMTVYQYELPDEIHFLQEMPLTGMNKVDYRKLEEIAKGQ